MLILSANNVADISANWAFGSIDEYKKYANEMVDRIGLKSVNVDDASGFSPSTVGTAEDLVKLGDYALKNPIIAEIVSQESIDLPDGTSKINTNAFLNYNNNGVIGIKNGLTDEAGGVLLAGAIRQVEGKKLVIITAVMGSEKYFDSQKDAVGLIEPTVDLLQHQAEIKAGSSAGYLNVPWIGKVPIIIKNDIKMDSFINAINKAELNVRPINSPKNKGDNVGTLVIYNSDGTAITTDLAVDKDIQKPEPYWKIKNPLKF
jgi:D-alanyl-D-alanine carboxypeptidase (penicillin-binding protein 5/6)